MVRLLGVGDNTVDIYLTEGMQYPGGNAVNVAVQASRCGAQASYLGCLGRDALGDLVAQSLIAEGVDVSHVRRIDGPNPWSRIRHQGPDRIFAGSNPGVRDLYDLALEDDAFIARHDVVHTSVHSGLDPVVPRLKAAARLLSYDYSEHWERPGVAETMRHVDIAFLSGPRRSTAACEVLARWCAAQGPAIVIITRGTEGALALQGGRVYSVPAHPAKIVDTLGAGDGFIAGFLITYAAGLSLPACLARGAAQAAAVCARKGGFGHGIPVVDGQPGLDATEMAKRPRPVRDMPNDASRRNETHSKEAPTMKRRDFTATALAGAGASLAASRLAVAPARAADKIVLHFLHRWPEPDSIKFFQDAVRAFEAAHPNISIVMEAVADEPYKAKIRVVMASGEIPDIYFTWVGEYTRQFIRAGRVLDITTYLAKPEWQGRFAPATLNAYKTDGKLYGVPVEVDAKFFVYNKALFAKAGITAPPADWPAFTVALNRIKAARITPIAFGAQLAWATVHYIGDLNAKLVPEDVRLADYALRTPADKLFTDPGYVDALTRYREFLTKAWFNRSPNAFSHASARASFNAGRSAMMYQELVEFGRIPGTRLERDGWGFFPMPEIPGGRGRQDMLTGAPDGFVVSSGCKHPDLAIAFLSFLTSKQRGADFTRITGRPSATLGAVTAANASPQTLRGIAAINQAKGLVLWLDTDVESRVASAFLAGGQALMSESGSPAEVMKTVRAAALQAQKDRA